MKLTARYLGLIFFVIFVSSKGLSQDLCEATLNRALIEFEAGHFHSIPSALKECLDNNENREWRQRAYLLLAETYLLLDDPFGAEQSYLQVLRANPEFVADENRDPIDLVYLSKKFTSTPIFTVYGKAGPNASPIRMIHNVKTDGDRNTFEKYVLRVGWHVGLGLDWNYDKSLSFSTELNYVNTAFRHETKNLFLERTNNLEGGERQSYSLQFNDKQNWINVPLIVKYSSDKGILRPYSYVGYSVSFLLKDKALMVLEGDNSPQLDFTSKRNSINTALLMGGGLKYKWNLDYFFAELRYGFGLTNVVSQRNRFDNVTYEWPYVDDDFRMDNICVSFGYIHPFYKPRKLKKAKTKSVLRKIKKGDEESD